MGVVSRLLASVVVLGSVVVAVVTVHAATAEGALSALTRYPYASEVVGTSATVNWATDRSQSTGSVTWGAVNNGSCAPSYRVPATGVSITVGSRSEYQWSARLTFPGPGTYCYRPQLGTTDLLGSEPSPQLRTSAATGSPFSFAVVGDFGAAGGGSTGEAAMMSQIRSSPASFVVSTGDSDNASGSQTDYGDLTQGNVFASAYLPKIGVRPIFAAQGNHGFTNNLPYLQNFPAPLAAQTSGGRNVQESYCCISTLSGRQNYASSWYAFDWGGARFYILEAAWADGQGGYRGDFLAHWNGAVAGCEPCGAELAWLKADLAAHAGSALKFAFFHYPLHADSSSQGSDTYLDGAGSLEGLLAANNVGVVFNGHAHIYERNLPQIPGSSMVSYVTGAGGAALGSVSGCSGFDAYAIGSGSSCRAPKPTSDSHVYEYLLVTVSGNQVTVTPTDSTGQTFDRQIYTFGTPPQTPDFSMVAAPTSVSLGQGSTGASTISTAVTAGSAQSVAFSAGGAPSGTSVSFSPTTVTAGQSSTMTVTTSASTPLGSSTITVTGIGSSATHTVPVDLTVTAAGAAPALVQSAGAAESSSSTALTGTFPTATGFGNLLVLSASVYTGASNRITSVSDSAGNAWTRIGTYSVSGHYSDGEMWFAANAKPVTSVTVHTASAATVSFAMQEYSGIRTANPLAISAGASNTGIIASSGSTTSTVPDSLVVGFAAGHGNTQLVNVTSPGFTVLPQQTSTGTAASVVAGFMVADTPGPQSFAAKFDTAMYWAAGVAVFSP
jgi:calcineurin-like phosphoesterase family protein